MVFPAPDECQEPEMEWDQPLLIDHPQGDGDTVRLPDLAPAGVGIKPVGADHDLALVGDVGDGPDDEFMDVDRKSRMPPGEDPCGPLRAEKLFLNQEPEHFSQ